MKLQSALVLVKDITSTVARTDLGVTEAQIDAAARLILETAGVINPPILLRTGISTYAVIDGHFEYYAALRARELDPRRGETINAYIAESDTAVEILKKQVELFRNSPQPSVLISAVTSPSVGDSLPTVQSLSTEMAELKSMITGQYDRFVKTLESQVIQLQNRLDAKLDAIVKIVEKPSLPLPLPVSAVAANRTEIEQQFIKDFNTLPIDDLLMKLERAGANKRVRDNIKKERETVPFQAVVSIDEFIKHKKRIRYLAQDSLNKILSRWS